MRPDGRPRILLTARRLTSATPPAAVERLARSLAYYVEAIRAAGGEPCIVRPGDPIPEDYDGVVFSGGPDVHPRHYGQEVDRAVRTTLTTDEDRDAAELALARSALADDRPILCICRGVQLLNVAAGGTLWQDLSLAGVDPAVHDRDGRGSSADLVHAVTVRPGSALAGILGQGEVGVNSFHHQAVAAAAPGFRITARAPDGVVEGLESREHRFVVGVQWHPERLVRRHPLHRRLFAALVEAARP
ncbi:MAG: gamma-glutamyl-gamma-aminobutyrate hydrolase family protein [Armatimonadota bacterium]|nr:gamma-glutamyl-gamma-aminobutyrate hydrolase family protein [Armatimonadota bacterium]